MPNERKHGEASGLDVRERLLRSATELFTLKGYAATTVREIVETSGVTKPVLYYYFKNKEGIFLELMRGPHARFLALLGESRETGGSAEVKIRNLLERMYDLFLENRDVARVGFAVYYGPPQGTPFFDFDDFHLKLQETLHILVREGVDRGEFRDGDAEGMTMAIIAVHNLVTQLELCRNELGIGPEGTGRLLDILFRGMQIQETIKGKRIRR